MTLKTGLFRREAFARRGQSEPIDGLLRVTAPHEWIILAGLGAAFLGVAAWSLFGRVERVLETGCLLAPSGQRLSVIAEVTGNVADILVNVGDPVEAGQPIARIVNAPELRRQAALTRARVEVLEAGGGDATGALQNARVELRVLEAMRSSGEFIRSPWEGRVIEHNLVPGQALTAGSVAAVVLQEAGQGPAAYALLPPERVGEIQVGMDARVLVPGPGGERGEVLDARVDDVSEQMAAFPVWLTNHGLDEIPHGHTVTLAVPDSPASASSGDTPCRVGFILSRDPPVRLLVSTGPGRGD